MKTTIEIPDYIYREAKARAAHRGVPLRQFFEDALAEKLARESVPAKRPGKKEWPIPPPKGVASEEIWRIQALIDEEFERIEPVDDDE